MLTKLSSKGQLIIPKPVRDALHLERGTQFQIRLHEGTIILEPLLSTPVEALRGKYADVDLLKDLETEHFCHRR